MAKAKKYTYKVTLRKKGEESVVTVEAATAHIDSRGNLYFTDSNGGVYSPSCVAAFCAGSWLSLTREKSDGDPTQ